MKGPEFNAEVESLIKILRSFKTEISDRDKTIREKDAEIKKLQKENSDLLKSLNNLSKIKNVDSDAPKTPAKSGKQIWEELKQEWTEKFPEYSQLPDRIGEALKSWKVPFYSWKAGNETLKNFIKLASDEEKGIPAKEIYNIVTLVARVDFSKYTEYVPNLSSCQQLVTKFTVFRDFFYREGIYYYPPSSPGNPHPNYKLDMSALKPEYRRKV